MLDAPSFYNGGTSEDMISLGTYTCHTLPFRGEGPMERRVADHLFGFDGCFSGGMLHNAGNWIFYGRILG